MFLCKVFRGGIGISSVLDILVFRYSKVLRYISMKILTMNDNEDKDKSNFTYTTEAANIYLSIMYWTLC